MSLTMPPRDDLLINVMILLVLPVLAIQMRYFIYSKVSNKSETNESLISKLQETLPHDLCIMGMTLSASNLAWGLRAGAAAEMIVLFGIMIPLYCASFLPLLETKHLKVMVGLMAYACGASGTLFLYIESLKAL